jgi:putative ABC transport system permease protein
MFRNIPFILRRFGRHKLTASLHVIGLTLGITVCLLIGLFIKHELSFDRYEEKADRTYRVNQVWVDDGKKEFHYSTPFPLAEEIRKSIAGLENVTKVHHPFSTVVEINPFKRFKQDHVMMTDPEFLDVFDVKAIEGNAYESLRKPYYAVLTKSTAKKFYGNEDPLGKVFKFNDKYNITVGAVIPDFPGNTHLPASMLLSFSTDNNYIQTSLTHYGSVSGGSTFIVLPKGVAVSATLKAGLRGIYDRTVNKASYMIKNSHCELELQPLSDVHFNSKYGGGGEWVKAINRSWLWFFGSVGFAVLLLACINFINLSTAQALTRAKEVGVRKTIGAGQFQLIGQFLQEALLLVTLAGIVAILIVKLSLPAVNNLVDKQISFDIFKSLPMIGALAMGILFTALMAGLYPAWLITKFRPAATLKAGPAKVSPQSVLLRKGLVVAQFSISVCLLIAVLLIGRQMRYMRSKNLGFAKDNIITVRVPQNVPNSQAAIELFQSELSRVPSISQHSISTSPPSGENVHWGTGMSLIGREDPDRKPVTFICADDKYCSMYGFQLKAGRFPVASDTNFVSESLPEGQRYAKSVVNETLVKTLGFESNQAALGKRFWVGMNGWTAEVVGVVSDFNTGPLREEVKPAVITQYAPSCDLVSLKIRQGANIPEAINKVSDLFKKAYPSGIFEYNFLDQQLDAIYKTEARLYSLFKIFSGLAILISCLGLWGLISFAAQQRIKEIGIRKVLGASVPNIVGLLTRDFILMVMIAIVIASPLAYWGIHKWLQEFAFRIDIGWVVFLVAGLGAIAIALITVSFQAIRAAISNPVKSLRTE